ncbi:MAG: methionyl-tRNA formyltransferase [Bdellovibrionales bacterium]|nr:methionyl-tRNA formyltransferase [Bdellovibrionales bacterium]
MRVVFFGSPDFAVASLEALHRSAHRVVGVVSQPDRPANRGLAMEAPAVKKFAVANNMEVLQPEKVNSDEVIRWIADLSPDILAVVAYGEFLGDRLLKLCRYPPVNVHPSLLPDLRGAAPIQWSLIRGLAISGVTTQFMSREMDSGDILLQEEVQIGREETAGELFERLRHLGGELLVKTLDGLERGEIKPRPQDHARATFAPMLKKEMGHVPWDSVTAWDAHNLVRGLCPWPGAWALFQGKRVKILKTASETPLVRWGEQSAPGSFTVQGNSLLVRCSDALLEVLLVQPEGKRPMLPREFVNGIKGVPEISWKFDGARPPEEKAP